MIINDNHFKEDIKMKVLVVDMPKNACDCIFAKSLNTIAGYHCTLKASKGAFENDICSLRYEEECPYLKEYKEETK